MRNLLFVLIILLITSCDCNKGDEIQTKTNSPTANTVTLSHTYPYVIKDNTLIINDEFSIKSKVPLGTSNIVYSLYKNDKYTNIYTFHANIENDKDPITSMVNALINEWNEKHKLERKAFQFK